MNYRDATRKMNKQVVLLTLGCIALYFVIRNMPVEPCNFLHYKEEVTENGVVEYCGPDETNFYNLEEIRFPIQVELKPLTDLVVGKECEFEFSLETISGGLLIADDIGVTHTEKIHLMMVDPSLKDYQHVHPTEEGSPGLFRFKMTPQRSGIYCGFFDFVVAETGRKILLLAKVDIPGSEEEPDFDSYDWNSEVAGHVFELTSDHETLKVRQPEVFRLKLKSKGYYAKFEPVMGAYAHLVAFDEKRSGFAHLHPLNSSLNQDITNPDLSFSFNVFDPGNYRLWAQVKLNGEELFIPFNLNVEG